MPSHRDFPRAWREQAVADGESAWCEDCNGEGWISAPYGHHYNCSYRCGTCDGEGIVSLAEPEFEAEDAEQGLST